MGIAGCAAQQNCAFSFILVLQCNCRLEATPRPLPLLNSLDAFRHFLPFFSWCQEEVHIVGLNPSRCPIATRLLFRGTVDFCLFHPRDVFRFVMEVNASSFILAHNHPSGDSRPSVPDVVLTRKLQQAARLFEIEFVDHLILTEKSYSSLKELGIFKKRRTQTNSF
jgi:DNA repair protein RadC